MFILLQNQRLRSKTYAILNLILKCFDRFIALVEVGDHRFILFKCLKNTKKQIYTLIHQSQSSERVAAVVSITEIVVLHSQTIENEN